MLAMCAFHFRCTKFLIVFSNFWFKKISLLHASFVHVLKLYLCITTWLLIEVAILLTHLPFCSRACWKLLNLKALDLQIDNRYDLSQIWGYFITHSQHLPMDHINCASTILSYNFYSNLKPRTKSQHRQGFTSTTSTQAFPLNATYFIYIVAVFPRINKTKFFPLSSLLVYLM